MIRNTIHAAQLELGTTAASPTTTGGRDAYWKQAQGTLGPVDPDDRDRKYDQVDRFNP
jgi:hypothetical protein